jgi:gluconolactonase
MSRGMKILGTFILLASPLLAVGASGSENTPPARLEFNLQAESPKFWDLVDHNAKLSVVGTGFGFTEGPVWDPEGFLYVSDETINKIYRLYPDGRKEEVIALGDPDGNTFDRQHRLIDCASVLRAIIAVTPDGKYNILADHYDGKKLNSPTMWSPVRTGRCISRIQTWIWLPAKSRRFRIRVSTVSTPKASCCCSPKS